MPRSIAPFISTMASVFLAALFIVMSTAFVTLPQAIGGFPGEAGIRVIQAEQLHLS